MPFLMVLMLLSVLAGALLWLWERRLRRRAGLPTGGIRYADAGDGRAPLLRSERWGLQGRPDYVVQEGRRQIPVEVKSGNAPAVPYDSHRLQLAAYCLLIEETAGQAPPYGIIRYDDRTVRVPYDEALRRELLDVLETMRRHLRAGDPPSPTSSPARCAHCGYADICTR
ncbi:MAG: CRISPR-associated protein Cas4 [Anaerolineae bacterium]